MASVSLEKLLILTLITYIQCAEPEQCIQDNYCSCHFQDDRKIDISPLFANASENRFLEADRISLNGSNATSYRFFFHGCSDAVFKLSDYAIPASPNLPNNVTGSLIVYSLRRITFNATTTVIQENLTVLGTANQIQYHVLGNEQEPYELIYKNKSDGRIHASFRLICEKYEKPFIQIIDDPNSGQFTLNSPYACIVKTEPKESSVGATLLIIFLIVCLFYFVGGGCVLYFARGARGAELIPNIDFWKKLPGLVRDGALFVCGGCTATHISSEEAYDRI